MVDGWDWSKISWQICIIKLREREREEDRVEEMVSVPYRNSMGMSIRVRQRDR